jgi:hypothetical protein
LLSFFETFFKDEAMSDPQTVAAPPASASVPLQRKQSLSTLVTLGSMVELTSRVAERIVGGEIASSVGGTALNKDMIAQLTLSVAQKHVAKQLGE